MEVGAGTDHLGLRCERQATLCDDRVKFLDGLEIAVGQRLVDERPQMF